MAVPGSNQRPPAATNQARRGRAGRVETVDVYYRRVRRSILPVAFAALLAGCGGAKLGSHAVASRKIIVYARPGGPHLRTFAPRGRLS
jgi:hypothetical protein